MAAMLDKHKTQDKLAYGTDPLPHSSFVVDRNPASASSERVIGGWSVPGTAHRKTWPPRSGLLDSSRTDYNPAEATLLPTIAVKCPLFSAIWLHCFLPDY